MRCYFLLTLFWKLSSALARMLTQIAQNVVIYVPILYIFTVSWVHVAFTVLWHFRLLIILHTRAIYLWIVLAVGWVILRMSDGIMGYAVPNGDMSAGPWLYTWFTTCPFSVWDPEQLRCCRAKSLCPICYRITAAADWWSVFSLL